MGSLHAEILTIGDEICRGDIIDTNSAWLAEQLWQADIPVTHITSCCDVEIDMVQALRLASSRSPLVFVSGGLGPTVDDKTVDVVSCLLYTSPSPRD